MRRRWSFTEASAEGAALAAQVATEALPLAEPRNLDPLFARMGSARFVLLGEASHGTAEFYDWRTIISRRLIEEHGFRFIAVEGDWPDCYRINRFVRGDAGAGDSARDVLHNFERWPTWMWANEEVLALIEWLRQRNEALPPEKRVGFYGLDVYSLWDSLYQVMSYLDKAFPEALPAAQRAFQCFEPYGEDVQDYAQATRWLNETCEDEVVSMLAELRRSAAAKRGGNGARGPTASEGQEARFNAEQNARVVQNAERYYRTMVRGDAQSWNIRDRHMHETLLRLMQHHGPQAKAIVWEHNTHIGDARYTDMAEEGMVNVGQLVRQSQALSDVVLVGFASHRGSVIAGRGWEAPMERMPVPAGRPGTWEDILHRADIGDALLIFRPEHGAGPLAVRRGHRAIGVVYHPEREAGNYVSTILPRRYDALLFFDETRALHPLHEVPVREEGEVPETYPSGV